MNDTLRAVIVEVTGGNVRNHHINLRGPLGLFPDDCLGGSNEGSEGRPIKLEIGADVVNTDTDHAKGIFRERGAFENEQVIEGDLILIERVKPRHYRISKASKRGLKYYL